MKDVLERAIKGTIESLSQTFDDERMVVLEEMITTVIKALKTGNKLLLCGNGGSAADSQHIAAEFIGRFKKERQSYPAIALTTDTSILTAVGNDYSFDEIFSRQVSGLGQTGDILIAISTSGNSPNVLCAVAAAKAKGMTTFGFSGKKGGALKEAVDFYFAADSDNTPSIQSAHIIALHTLCEVVENTLA